MAEKRKRRRPVDRLIASLIAKLPSPGDEWPAERQKAWLRMMEMALNVTYGNATEISQNEAPRTGLGGFTSIQSGTKPLPAFVIDADGYARRGADWSPLNPRDVQGATIYDLRGEQGDLSSITWADGTRGVTGLHLDISTAV